MILLRNSFIKLKKKIVIDLLLIFILGALSSLSLPPLNFFLVNFLSLTIFYIFLFKKLDTHINKKVFFFYGWSFGFGYFLTNLYWITISLTFDENFNFLIPLALFLIPAFLAVFYGFGTFIFGILNIKNVVSSFFLFSLIFGLTEFIRGNILTGFPWNLIVYSLSEKLNFIAFLSIIGTYSLNLLVISFFSAPALFILRKSKREIIVLIFLVLTPIMIFLYGSFYKNKFLSNELESNPILIRVIGSNISLDRFYINIDAEKVINELIELSSPDKNKKILFLWPEGIIPVADQNEFKLYKDLFTRNFNENHLIGLGITNKMSKNGKDEYFNSFSVFDNHLNLIENYNKINLVPFGEFLPFENFLNKIGLKTITRNVGSFSKGEYRNIIKVQNDLNEFKFLPLICYEIIYSGELTKNFNFNFIANISEDGWFGKSIGPKQHFVHSIYRAIEIGKYVVRSANNGMTAVINPLGEIERKIDYGKGGFVDFDKRRVQDSTFFSKYGNKIFGLLILLYIFLIFSFNRMKNE